MKTTNTEKDPDREWLRRMADAEELSGSIAVGGLAADLGVLRKCEQPGDSESVTAAIALAKLVEFWRRKHELTVEGLAKRANLSEVDVLSVESGELIPEPRVLRELSEVLFVSYTKLLHVAGYVSRRDDWLSTAARHFATRSEPNSRLTPLEDAALKEFLSELTGG